MVEWLMGLLSRIGGRVVKNLDDQAIKDMDRFGLGSSYTPISSVESALIGPAFGAMAGGIGNTTAYAIQNPEENDFDQFSSAFGVGAAGGAGVGAAFGAKRVIMALARALMSSGMSKEDAIMQAIMLSKRAQTDVPGQNVLQFKKEVLGQKPNPLAKRDGG
jgi:hypothetical protein